MGGAGGAVVGRFQSLELPLPTDDLADMTIGGMHLRTTAPLRGYELTADYENARVEVDYQAFTDALALGLEAEGADLGAHHYESMGRVAGRVTVDGRVTEVSGWGFQDHSWGPRNWGNVRATDGSWLHSAKISYCAVVRMTTPAGPAAFGYVFDAGVFHEIASVDCTALIAGDGHTPIGCAARFWTTDGRGYHITGDTSVTSSHSHDQGFFFTSGLTVFSMGGRLGTGIFETSELKTPTPVQRLELGLDQLGVTAL